MWGTVGTATDLVAWKKEKGGERMMETHLPAEKKCTDVTVINIFLTFTLLPGSIKCEVVFNIKTVQRDTEAARQRLLPWLLMGTL